jgi:hypothetical protein
MKRALLITTALSVLALASLAHAETIQKGSIRIAFDGKISPSKLPRTGMAPVSVTVGTKISATKAKPLAQLQKIEIAINSHGRLDATGLPKCEVGDIQPATTAKALEECRPSLIGEGSFSSEVSLSKQAAFPSQGKLYAFNGTYKGRPAILAHVFGSEPVPTSFTLPFVIAKAKGTFGTKLTATIPASEDNLITGIELTLHRLYSYKGKSRSYAQAGCPAPKGFPGASFPFAKASYEFVGGKKLSSTLTRACRARG